MSNYNLDAVAGFADKAADVGDRDAALRTQEVLKAKKARIDSQLAAEIVALDKRGEASSETYRMLLSESTALNGAIGSAKVDAAQAAVKEERLELNADAAGGAEMAVAKADSQLYKQLYHAFTRKGNHEFEVPMPVLRQDAVTGETRVIPVKATDNNLKAAAAGDFVANANAGAFTVPTLVTDLITYIVTYPRLYNKFKMYQTVGIENVAVNRLAGINPAPVVGTRANNGEMVDLSAVNAKQETVGLDALKVAGYTRITRELVQTLPADMLQTEISSYLAQSLGLRFATDAVSGDGGASAGQGVANWLGKTAGSKQLFVGKTGVSADTKTFDRNEVGGMLAKIGAAYQSIAGNVTLAGTPTTFWTLFANIHGDGPLFADSRAYEGQRLGMWDFCVDDAFAEIGDGNIPLVGGDFGRAWAIRYGGALRLEVSYDDAFLSDQITVKAVQHFDTQPIETPAVAGYQSK